MVHAAMFMCRPCSNVMCHVAYCFLSSNAVAPFVYLENTNYYSVFSEIAFLLHPGYSSSKFITFTSDQVLDVLTFQRGLTIRYIYIEGLTIRYILKGLTIRYILRGLTIRYMYIEGSHHKVYIYMYRGISP